MDTNNILQKSVNSAFNASKAMSLQIICLMPLRTLVNHQYRHGQTISSSAKMLYGNGGITRFYRGISYALIQAPIMRGSDFFCNELIKNKFENSDLNTPVKTGISSTLSGLVRLSLMPIDTLKTTYQVEGKNGLSLLKNKYRQNGISIFFHGYTGMFTANFVGNFPWFLTYNLLNNNIPEYKDDKLKSLTRNAFIGFCSSLVSDSISNPLRVLKVYKQTNKQAISYTDAFKQIMKTDGLFGLWSRGLKMKVISNGIQGSMFAVIFKLLENR